MITIFARKTMFIIYVIAFLSLTIYSKPIDSLYKYRQYYSELTEPCGYYLGNRFFDCGQRFKTIKSFSNKTYHEWVTADYTICNAILGLTSSWKDLEKVKSKVIHDSILAYSICIILQYDTLHGGNLARSAYTALIEDMPFNYLAKYNHLIKNIKNMKTFNAKEKDKLLALSSPDSLLIEQLLMNDNLENAYRARLGDEVAEKQIIAEFDTTNNFQIATKGAENLGICGSKRCIERLIINFNRPLYYYKNPKSKCINKTLRVAIIKALQRYHPSEDLLNKKYLYMAGRTPHNVYDLSDTLKTKPYIDSLIAWMEKTYHVKPKGPIGKYIFLNENCGRPLYPDNKPDR